MAGESNKILICDDDPKIVDLVVRALEPCGHSVETVNDGSSALAALRDGDYELLIIDLVMPEVDGSEVIKKVRTDTDGGGPKIIAISGGGPCIPGTYALHIAAGMGADFVLYKPFSMSELRDTVAAAFDA